MKLTTTKKAATHVKALVYGRSGVGKTTICATMPNPVIISAESGTLSIMDDDIPMIEVYSLGDLYEALEYLKKKKVKKMFDSICLDSITDIAETVLSDAKSEFKDARQAYGSTNDEMMKLIKKFRDLKGYHVLMTAKVATNDDGEHFPAMPGKKMTQDIGYFFDEVFALRVWEDDEEEEESKRVRYLQTDISMYWDAKDRSGKLKFREKPDMKSIIKKILTGKR